jgi:hypothetical protein
MSTQKFIKVSDDFFADADYAEALGKLGLNTFDDIFNFDAGKNLAKANLAKYRTRIQFDLDAPRTTLFLKRYNRPPISTQIKNWLHHYRRLSTSDFDNSAAEQLSAVGIGTPKTIARGRQWGLVFERRSFIITEKIPNAQALERKLPDFFGKERSTKNLKQRREFIKKLADFIRRFHESGFRHCDLYFSHIFHTAESKFYLIDLQRVFKPLLLTQRSRIKDIAQLYYSAPAKYFSLTDRLRFYIRYTGTKNLTRRDKRFIRKVNARAERTATHDANHGRAVGFAI